MGEGAKAEAGYVPGPDFEEDNRESLIDIQMNENTELWLIQLPNDKFPDLDGQKVSLELDGDGPLGTVEGKSGKAYDLINYPSEAADITVFLSSPSGPKVAGKISRHVSLVHYPDPEELKAREAAKEKERATKNSTSTSHPHSISSKSKKISHSQSKSRSTYSNKRSSVSGVTDGSRHSKRSNGDSARYSNQSAQESGRRSDVTFSGSSELSLRKKKKTANEA